MKNMKQYSNGDTLENRQSGEVVVGQMTEG